MFSKIQFVFGLCAVLTNAFRTGAIAATRPAFSVVGGIQRTSTTTENISDTRYSAGNGWVGGFLLDFNEGYPITVETAFLYESKMIHSNPAGSTTLYQESFHQIEIPLLARFRLFRRFNFGIGPYADFGIGKISEADSTGGSSTTSFSAANLHAFDDGMLASLQFHFFRKLFLDARANVGLSNLSGAPGTSFKFNSFSALLGFNFEGNHE